jgi:hypothetical protein
MNIDENDSLFSRPIRIIKYQAYGALAGSILYPCLSLVLHRSIILYTPVCVCTHLVSMFGSFKYMSREIANNKKYENYKQVRLELNSDFDIKIKLELEPKSSIFSFDLNKLRNNKSINPNKSNFMGFNILNKNNKINRFHINETDSKIIDKIMDDRSFRFRHILGVTSTMTITGKLFQHIVFGNRTLLPYVLIGLTIGLYTIPSDDSFTFYQLKSNKKNMKEFIDQKYIDQYVIEDCEYFYYIDLFGNIVYSTSMPFTFRKIYLLLKNN